MGSAKKTVQPSKTETVNTAPHPITQSTELEAANDARRTEANSGAPANSRGSAKFAGPREQTVAGAAAAKKKSSRESSPKAAQPGVKSLAKSLIGSLPGVSPERVVSEASYSHPSGVRAFEAAPVASVDLDGTTNRQELGRAEIPGLAAACHNLNPGVDEQKIVTKKTEKRISVESAADIELSAIASTAKAIVKPHDKPGRPPPWP